MDGKSYMYLADWQRNVDLSTFDAYIFESQNQHTFTTNVKKKKKSATMTVY